ncbi:MAG: hypothetical protein QG551_438 [Patescibacteria group bacterium]|nr:hypothetical protein [Patescibacteria group bacterium]
MSLENTSNNTGGGLSALEKAKLLKEQKENERKDAEEKAQAEEDAKQQEVYGTLSQIDGRLSGLEAEKLEVEESIKSVRGQRFENINTQRSAVKELKSDEATAEILDDKDTKEEIFSEDEGKLEAIKEEEENLNTRLNQIQEEIASLKEKREETFLNTPEGQREKDLESREVMKTEIQEVLKIKPLKFEGDIRDLDIRSYSDNLTALVEKYDKEQIKEALVEIQGQNVEGYFEKKIKPVEETIEIAKGAWSPELRQAAMEKYEELKQAMRDFQNTLTQKNAELEAQGLEKLWRGFPGGGSYEEVLLAGSELRTEHTYFNMSDENSVSLLFNPEKSSSSLILRINYSKVAEALEKKIGFIKDFETTVKETPDKKTYEESIKGGFFDRAERKEKAENGDKIAQLGERWLQHLDVKVGKIPETVSMDKGYEVMMGDLNSKLEALKTQEKDAIRVVELQVERGLDERLSVQEAKRMENGFKLINNSAFDVVRGVEEIQKTKDKAKEVFNTVLSSEIKLADYLDKKISFHNGRMVYEGAPEAVKKQEEERMIAITQYEKALEEKKKEYARESSKNPFFGKDKHQENLTLLKKEIADLETRLNESKAMPRVDIYQEDKSPELGDVIDKLYKKNPYGNENGPQNFIDQHQELFSRGVTLKEVLEAIKSDAEAQSTKELPGKLKGFKQRQDSYATELQNLKTKYQGVRV